MNKKGGKTISDFTSGYYSGGFYGDGSKLRQQKIEKFILEFNYYNFMKFIIYYGIFIIIVFILSKIKYNYNIAFLFNRLLIINGLIWGISTFVVIIMFYKSIKIKKVRNQLSIKKDSLDKFF